MSVSFIDGHIDDDVMTFEELIEELEKVRYNATSEYHKAVIDAAIDTLKKQKAVIERLQEFLDDKCDRCIEKERTEAVKEFANEFYHVFAGHSDYHGDTILTKIACLAEGKAIKCAEPIDTNHIKAEAVKEFAERLKDMSEHFWEEKENFVSEKDIDNLVKEMVGDG